MKDRDKGMSRMMSSMPGKNQPSSSTPSSSHASLHPRRAMIHVHRLGTGTNQPPPSQSYDLRVLRERCQPTPVQSYDMWVQAGYGYLGIGARALRG